MIISNYSIGKEIGSGAFGAVNIAEHRTSGEKVAVKCISKSRIQRSNMGSQVKKEIMTMKKLDHPNIVQIKEVLMSNSHLYLVLEYVGGGELFSKIATQGKLSENVARRYFKQVMEAVKFCHKLYICHRDIKPENILLDSEDNVKIADFGFASIMEPEPGSVSESPEETTSHMSAIDENIEMSGTITPLRDFVPDDDESAKPSPNSNKFRNLPSAKMQKMSTMCGTTQYMAPEIVNRDSYRGDKADIWSCGIVLFVLVAGFLPFDSSNPEIVIQKIRNSTFKTPSSISDLARDVIEKLLTPNPLVRPGARTILAHEWFKDMGRSPPKLVSAARPQTLPRVKSTLPTSLKKNQNCKLLPKEDRTTTVNMKVDKAVSSVTDVLRSNMWIIKLDTEAHSTKESEIKGSRMTSTGLAMIHAVFASSSDNTTTVEVGVFGGQRNSGAREINKLVADIKALH